MKEVRAYSLFHVKALDGDRRVFSGVATTPATDRVGDEIMPLGLRFKNPLVLLRGHSHSDPIGRVTFKKPTAKGVEFEAEIPVVTEECSFKDKVDSAWAEIAYGVVRAVSIGFRAITWRHKDDGGIIFDEAEVYELSTVAVPALPEAVISAVRSFDGSRLPMDVIRAISGSSTIPLINHKTLPPAGIPLVRAK